MVSFITESSEQTESRATGLASVIQQGMIIHLQGELGAGKTTFARGFLSGLGHCGTVKSPTYNIVHSYQTKKYIIHHFDLYRLSDSEELEAMGIRDYFDGASICLLEWPQNGKGLLPNPDILINLRYEGEKRHIEFEPISEAGLKTIDFYKEI
ncbi:MAG: tRNA (adenosine(37)-N6)-threonylcarbamoyltransferase complex ATPase subunit type 1 TsaE [Gammaproteobacteria bacterium]